MILKFIVSIFIFLVVLVGCSNSSQNVDQDAIEIMPSSEPSTGVTHEGLLEALNTQQINAVSTGKSFAFLLSDTPGISYQLSGKIDEELLYIHEYPSTEAAEKKASAITPQIRMNMLDWVDTPHFFLCNTMIVLYLGDNPVAKTILSEQCGPQFAGRP